LPVQLFYNFCHFSDISFVVRGSSGDEKVTAWKILKILLENIHEAKVLQPMTAFRGIT